MFVAWYIFIRLGLPLLCVLGILLLFLWLVTKDKNKTKKAEISSDLVYKANKLGIDCFMFNQYLFSLRIKSKVPNINDGKHFKILENNYWCTYRVYSMWKETKSGDYLDGDNGNYGDLVLVDIEGTFNEI
jgi:hypothetical protein